MDIDVWSWSDEKITEYLREWADVRHLKLRASAVIYTYIALFTLPALACGVRTSPALKAESAIISESTPADQSVMMVVVAEKGVNVRSMPSENASYTRDALEFGDMVTVDEVKMIGDSNWCHHEYGWSNCKWLKALEAIR